MDDPNPYQAPETAPGAHPIAFAPADRPGRRRLIGWAAVFVANLPIPLMFSGDMTDAGAKVGMWAAIVVLFLLGGVACMAWNRVGLALIVGGAAVALSQVAPGLQIIAGSVGIAVGSLAGLTTPMGSGLYDANGPACGFLVTMVTGTLLMIKAIGLGLLFQLLTPSRWWRLPPRADETD